MDKVEAFLRHADTGEARWWLGSLATILATSKNTGGQFCLIDVQENEGETPLHVHHNEDETFIVLAGDIEFEVGGNVISAQPGAVLFGPRGVPHRYTVRRGPARMMFLLTPAGFEGLVRATSEPAPERRIPSEGEGLPDFETFPATAQRFGCELLGRGCSAAPSLLPRSPVGTDYSGTEQIRWSSRIIVGRSRGIILGCRSSISG